MRQLGPLLLGLAFSSVALAADTPEKPILVLDSGGHTSIVKKVRFTPDGKELISVSEDKTIRFWDVASGEPTRVLRPPIGPGNEGRLYAAALSPDGRTLAVGGLGLKDALGSIYLISTHTGRIERVLKGHTRVIISLAFGVPPGGRLLLASGSGDKTARIWDVAAGVCQCVLKGHTDRVQGVAFAPDASGLATASFDKTARIWSVAGGECLQTLQGHTKEVRSVAWSPDGQLLATGGDDRSIRLWSPDGTLSRNIENLDWIISVMFTPDSRELLYTWGGAGTGVGSAVLRVSSGEERLRFTKHDNTVLSGAISPDGTIAATTGGNSNEIYLWRLSDAALLHRLAGKGHAGYSAGWSPDGKSIAWGNTYKGTSWNDRGPLERSFTLADLEIGPSPDASYRRARESRGFLSLQPTGPTSLEVKQQDAVVAKIAPPNPYEAFFSFSFVTGDRVAVGGSYGLYLFDARTGANIRAFRGHTGMVCAVAPSPDGRYLLSASKDQTVRIWDPDRDEPLLSLFVAGDDWIAWTPEGYYAASPGGEQLMGWHVNNGPEAMASYYPASQFRKTFYRPDVIKRLLEAGSLDKALADADAAAGKSTQQTEVAHILPPKVSITTPTVAKLELNGNSLEVKAVASSVGDHAVTTLRLLLDGRPAPEGLKIFTQPKLGEVGASWTVEVPPGSHRLTVQASNAVSKAVSDPVEVVTAKNDNPAAASGSLYVLAVGINDYPDKRLKLDCAAPDAQSLRNAFLTNSSKLFRGVEVKLLLNGQATRASILEGLQWLSSSVKPGDMAVVFYAGHGDCKIEGQFYLVPVDANLRDLSHTAVSGEALKKAIGELPCTTMLLLDACYAGSFDGKKRKTRGLPAESDAVLRQLVYDAGLVVMCGASKEQEAAEEDGHGFFTQSLVEGLGGKADYNKDGVVELYELQLYVHGRVRELSAQEQEPTVSIPSVVKSFALSRP